MTMRKNGGRGPSIRDVAQEAGVSVSTISRYLNERERVSADYQQKIEVAIKKLNYHPSAVAQAFSRGTMKSVTVVVSNLSLFGPTMTVAGIERRAAQAQYAVNIISLEGDAASPGTVSNTGDAANSDAASNIDFSSLTQRLSEQSPSGILLVEYDKTGQEARQYLPEHIPCVAIRGDRDETDFPQISLASYQGGRSMTKYLLGLGHKTVYHVSVPARGAGIGRLEGWHDALMIAGANVPEPLEASWDPMSGYELGKQLATCPDCTAVFVGNDEIAMGVIAGISAAGRRVPEDISVAGLDNHPLGKVSVPALTTWNMRFEEAGAVAFDTLMRLPAEEGHVMELPGKLIERASSTVFL